jgi:hypothetical protein
MSRLGGLLLVAAALLVLPASASAATIFGADLSQSVTLAPACGSPAGQPCSVVTLTKTGGATETGSPVSGVLTSVRIKTASGELVGVQVRVLRPDPVLAYNYLNVGPEISIAAPANDGSTGGVISEATGIHHPISVGDRLGIGWEEPATWFNYGVNGASASCGFRQQPTFTDGSHPVDTTVVYNNAGCGFEVLVQGSVEPDADHDGFGDETQDQCPSNAAIQTACPTGVPLPGTAPKKKCKKKHRSADASVAKKKCKKKAAKLPV